MNDEEGKLIKSDTLFLNLYDFWTCFHATYKTLFRWYHPKTHLLEMALRKKWEATKDWPLVNIILKILKKKTNTLIQKNTWGRMKKNILNCYKIGKSILKNNI